MAAAFDRGEPFEDLGATDLIEERSAQPSLGQALVHERSQRRGVVTAVARTDVHRPCPVAEHGKRIEDVDLAAGDLRTVRVIGAAW